MKIILLENIKKRGKKGDVLDLANGYANFLIKSNKAIEATEENIKNLNEKVALEKEKEELHLREMNELKEKIEAIELKIQVKVGLEGKTYGSVSTKQIVNLFETDYGIKLDKKKITVSEPMNALGSYELLIDLAKGVKAKIKVHLVE